MCYYCEHCNRVFEGYQVLPYAIVYPISPIEEYTTMYCPNCRSMVLKDDNKKVSDVPIEND